MRVVINSNEAGEIRYIAQLASAGTPTLAAIKTGTAVAMASGNNTISLTGLTASTNYKISMVPKWCRQLAEARRNREKLHNYGGERADGADELLH